MFQIMGLDIDEIDCLLADFVLLSFFLPQEANGIVFVLQIHHLIQDELNRKSQQTASNCINTDTDRTEITERSGKTNQNNTDTNDNDRENNESVICFFVAFIFPSSTTIFG